MVTHIVCWNFIEGMTVEEKKEASKRIKESLSKLQGQIDGLLDISVAIKPLDSSNREIALICTLESEQALEHYQSHPKHLEAAGYIRRVTCDRICFDY